MIVTHRALDAALSATVEALRGLDVGPRVTSVMRVEGEVSETVSDAGSPGHGWPCTRRPRGVIARYRTGCQSPTPTRW